MTEILCIECGEDVSDMYWTSEFDDNVHGHRFCIEKYDKKRGREECYNTPRRQEFIASLETKMEELQYDLQVVKSYLSHAFILKELHHLEEALKIAQEETYYDVILERINHMKRWK